MSALTVHSVVGSADLANELIWLQVNQDIPDLHYYLLCDTTYTDGDHISNELRHTFWFPKLAAKKGDWICLRTRDGKNTSGKNDKGITIHTLYWKLGRTIWNKSGDAAVLFNLTSTTARRV